jgi:hypothetical protein
VYTVDWTDPPGVVSLVQAVEPPYANKSEEPDVTCQADVISDMILASDVISEHTAENVDAVTPLPQDNAPPDTPQLPFEVVIVKLLAEPENEYDARV